MESIREFAAETRARVVDIDDGGITGDAFYAHVRRLRAPVFASPKRHTSATPPRLGHRAVADVVESLVAFADSRGWRRAPAERWWVPADDPHRSTLGAWPAVRSSADDR